VTRPIQPIVRVTVSGDCVLKCGNKMAQKDNSGTKPYNCPICDDVPEGKGGTNKYKIVYAI